MTNQNRKIPRARARPLGPFASALGGPFPLNASGFGAWLRWRAADMARLNQDRMILALPVLFGLGIALWFALPGSGAGAGTVPLDPVLVVFFAAFAGALWWGRIEASRTSGALFAASLAALFLASGIGAMEARSQLAAAPRITAETVTLDVSGRLRTVSQKANGSTRIVIDQIGLPTGTYRGLPHNGVPDRLRLSLRGAQPHMQAGDVIAMRAVLRPPAGPIEPAAHDFARDAFFDRIGGTGFVYGKAHVTQVWHGDGRLLARLDIRLQRLRAAVGAQIFSRFDNPVAGGVAVALLTGERGLIPADVTEDLRGAGLAHLLAISGLHMGLAAGMLFFTVRLLLLLVPGLSARRPVKKWAAGAALIGAGGYLMLSGASVSAERAFIMVSCGFAAIMIDRVALSMRLVGFAAMMILVWRPESLLNAGFQMSFAAVAALIAVYEAARDRPNSPINKIGQHRITAYMVGMIVTSLIAGLATAPFAAWHFGRVADYGLLGNLLAMPVMALWVMPLGAAALVLLPFGLEAAPLAAMGWGIEWIVAVANQVTGLAGAELGIKAASIMVLALMAAGIVWMCLWRGWIRFAGILPIVVAISLWAGPSTQRPDILISDDASLIGVMDASGARHYSSLRKGRYDRTQWQKRDGDLFGTNAVRAACDGDGCLYPPTAQGLMAASVHTWNGLHEECARLSGKPGAIIIAQFRVKPKYCPGVYLIDEWTIKRGGAHAISGLAAGSGEGIAIASAETVRGRKPWAKTVPDKRPPIPGSIEAEQPDEAALNLDPVRAEDTRFIGGVGSFQRN